MTTFQMTLRNRFSDVKKFLIFRIKDLDYNETNIKKIRDQDLTGQVFLQLTEEKLTHKPGL